MATKELTDDQKRLLVLISRFSNPSKSHDDEETWIKKLPLMALIYRGIRLNVFRVYDFSPTLVEYMGTVRFGNISKEGEDDIADLRHTGFLKRLKLATSHHIYVSAYRITPKGLDHMASFDNELHKAIDELINCSKCNDIMEIEAWDECHYIICRKCLREEKIDLFETKEVAYVSRPIFSDIWLPMD